MTKRSGIGMRMYVDGVRISGDVGAVDSMAAPMNALEATGIEQLAMARMGGPRAAQVQFSSYFNDEVGASFPTLKTLPLTDRHSLTTVGLDGYAVVAKQLDFSQNRPQDGSLIGMTDLQSNGFGGEWGDILTGTSTEPERTDTAATNGTGQDRRDGETTSSAFGAQAYLQVLSFTGTDVTVKIQESSDDGAGDAWADVTGLTFTAATGATAERVATAAGATIERYLRVVTTGTFSSAVFVVMVVRNLTVVSF
jgi:hypothetical protein